MQPPLTRRDLGKLTLAAGVSASLPLTLSADTATMPKPEFDPVHWTLESYKAAPLRLTFNASTKADAEHWQHGLRAKITDLIGGFPQQRIPLSPQILETRDFPAYTRERFIFYSRPGVAVSAYLLKPKNVQPPYTPVICVPGHGRGADDIVGIDEHGNDRAIKVAYQYDFAIQVAELGLAAIAIEPLAFGCRRDAAAIHASPGQSSCQPSAGSALLFGETMIAWRVWDVMRTIDFIEQHSDLDSKRIGCIGISGGGTCTQFSAALDPRIKAAFVSGYLNTFRDSIMSVSHCIDNYVPSILNWAENYDVASLIAPRFFFSEGGDRDPIFPVAATRFAFGKVRHVYEVFGVPERAGQEIFEGEHQFHGKQGLPFLKNALTS